LSLNSSGGSLNHAASNKTIAGAFSENNLSILNPALNYDQQQQQQQQQKQDHFNNNCHGGHNFEEQVRPATVGPSLAKLDPAVAQAVQQV
jgi:hypothetical protein